MDCGFDTGWRESVRRVRHRRRLQIAMIPALLDASRRTRILLPLRSASEAHSVHTGETPEPQSVLLPKRTGFYIPGTFRLSHSKH